jgi:hypothetical protein
MTIFGRKFPAERLTDAVLKENGWLCDLLRHWHPSGDAIGSPRDQEGKEHLRLAIRNGYLNFYRAGQSVAKVRFDRRGKLQAKIHNKYVYGKRGSGQSYVTLTSAGFPEEAGSEPLTGWGGATCLRGWISNANEYVGDEKCFVDLVVAQNPNVIDVEMALPAYSNIPEERRAPRMDLVGLEPAGNGWRVVFWEAKLVSDGRARCRGEEKEPRVVKQLKHYTDWLDHENHRDIVAHEYQRTCRLLVELHAVARRVRADIEELGVGIREVAVPGAVPLLIDDKPRLLIDDRTRNVAFTKNKHLDKLRNTGLHVQMVQCLDQMTLETRA